MLGVYLLHCQGYLNFPNYGIIFNPFYVNGFFFISGFLFLRNRLNFSNLKQLRPVRIFNNILFRIIIPSILFSLITYLPKQIYNNSSFNFINFLIDIFGGVSFWFTSALTVAQLAILLLIMAFIRYKHKLFYIIFFSAILFIFFAFVFPNDPSNDARTFFPWFWKTGLCYSFVFSLGGIYAKYESFIDRHTPKLCIVGCFIAWLGLSILSYFGVISCQCLGIHSYINGYGAVAIVCSIVSVIIISKHLRGINWLKFIGKNYIIFYFFSGIVPSSLAYLSSKFYIQPSIFPFLIIFIIATVCAYYITILITKYIPFLTDFRLINEKRK